jgi:MFS family permease
MRFAPYRTVLRLPGMRTFMLIALVARIPGTMTGTVLTLSVVIDRHQGYGTAGLLSAAYTIGMTIGSPLLGRMVDRRGPRPVMVITGLAALAYWTCAPALPLDALLPVSLVAGALQVPIMALVRQSLAAKVPEESRRQAFSLDSMAVEFSFMIGPALAVLLITQLGDATSTLRIVGVSVAAAAAVMYTYNPRVTTKVSVAGGVDGMESGGGVAGSVAGLGGGAAAGQEKPNWLAPGFLLILAIGLATCLVLGGSDVSIVATLRSHGQTEWAGAVIATWCGASMVGGFAHGARAKPLSMLTLMFVLGAATIPAGLAHAWWLLALALIPAGLACAPTLSAAVNAVSSAVPESARGQAIGLSSGAFTLGNAMGAPLAGFVIDHSSPAFGFAAVGAVGAGAAVLAVGARAARGRVRAESRRPGDVERVALGEPLGEGSAGR